MAASRKLTRQAAFQALFESDFRDHEPITNFERIAKEAGGNVDVEFGSDLITSVTKNLKVIDKKILEAAPDWPIDQVAKVDKAALRLGIGELFHAPKSNKQTPTNIIINEAVELAKRFGNDSSRRFVNGVLGTLSRKYNKK